MILCYQNKIVDLLFEEGSSIDFLDLSTNNPTSWMWLFPGGNPSFSTSQNPTGILYSTPGFYDVTLIANNPSGADTLTKTAYHEVYSQNVPITDFAASNNQILQGDSINFIDITQNNPTSWTWYFPGGNPAVSVDENPSGIIYNSVGNYDVTLITSNASGIDTLTKTDFIQVVSSSVPACDFIANNISR